MKAKEFENTFDEGDSVFDALDLSKAKRVLQGQKRVNVDFPAWMICETSDLIWRLQKIVSTLSSIDCLFSTPMTSFGYDFTLPYTCHSPSSTFVQFQSYA